MTTTLAFEAINIRDGSIRNQYRRKVYNLLSNLSNENRLQGLTEVVRQPASSHQAAKNVFGEVDGLLEQYHALVDLELANHLTATDTVRLRDIENELDKWEAHDPSERAINERMQETSRQLDAILENLQNERYRPQKLLR